MSSGGSSRSSGKGNNGISSTQASSKKMIQSLKEIVNCPEHEIYAMLKECNMDPNDTVNRLLSQDPFHEVKSRREKKKEIKETSESRSRGVSITSNRGGRSSADRNVGRGGATQFSSTEPGVLRGKPAYKKENGTNAFPSSSSSASDMVGNNMNIWPPSLSDSVTVENKTPAIGTSDGIFSSSQPSPGFQSAWLGVPGQVSMADIVKMGRPRGKASSISVVSSQTCNSPHHTGAPNSSYPIVKHPHLSASLPAESHHHLYSSQDHASKASEISHEPGMAESQHVSHDEWPVVEQPPDATVSSVFEPSVASEVYADPSNLHVDRTNLHLNSQSDEVLATEEGVTFENLNADHIGSASLSSIQIEDDNFGGASDFDNNSFKNMSSYQPHRIPSEHQEGIGDSSHLSIPNYSESTVEDVSIVVSSATTNLQQLSLQEELQTLPAEDKPAVVIPNHLQVPSADCSHLSFGSFGSGINASISGSFASKPLKSNLQDASAAADDSPVGQLETKNPEYFGDEQQLRSTSDGNVTHRTNAGAGSYDSPSSSQSEVMKQEIPEVTHGHSYTFPTSVPGFTFEDAQQLNAALSYAQTNSQMQNLAPFSNVMQAYTNSLPSNLLASVVQPGRESDPYSTFLGTQLMATKYSNTGSSINGPSISMPEAVNPGVFSTQPTPQTLPGAGIATGPALPQHLTLHPYSQPTLPLGHFPNMISYPFMPQSYTYMPSAFQQAYADNSAGIKYNLPQYKNSVSVSSLPQSAAIASGYGGFGSSTNIPGSFLQNPSSTPASTTLGYNDLINSQYKDSNHFAPLQQAQNESSAGWVHGSGSRTMSAVPASTYYSFQGQNQPLGFRQGQQPSQNYGALGYPNFYHSQTGISQEHQQQNASDATLGGSQGPPSKQSNQLWQHSY